MEYFSNVSQLLARTRCLLNGLKSIENHDVLPYALCYVPSYLIYRINSSTKPEYVDLNFYSEPNLASDVKKVVIPAASSLLYAESEPVANEDGYWLKIFEIVSQEMKKIQFRPPKYYLLQRSSCLDIPELQLINYKITSNGQCLWKGQNFSITSWEQVVEIYYGVAVTLPALKKQIVESKEASIETMRNKPFDGWVEKHDEQLIRFLTEHPDDSSQKMGTIWACVEKIDLSTWLDSLDESVSALTDDNHNTYWESDSNQHIRYHFIRLTMKEGAVIDKIFLNVDVYDDSYMPHKIEIFAGTSISILTKLSEIDLENAQTGDVCVFEGSDLYYPMVEIRIVECKDEGIDTRIRGLKISTKNFAPADLSMKLFSPEHLANYSLLVSADPKRLYWRATVLKRLVVLLDSVITYLVPKAETDQEDDFSQILKKARILFPLCKRRKALFDTFIKETEKPKTSFGVPKLFVNRRLALENRSAIKSTVFRQIFDGLKIAQRSDSPITYRFSAKVEQWWECKFIGEGVIDQGGGFRDSLCDIAEELCPSESNAKYSLPYFVRAASQFEDESIARDVYVVNPGCDDFEAFEWIGKLIGACLRTKEKLILPLSRFTWKRLLGYSVNWHDDFSTVDYSLVSLVDKIQNISEDSFYELFGRDQYFTCILSGGVETEITKNGSEKKLTFENRLEYVNLLKSVRLNEGCRQVEAIRNGLLKVVPFAALNLITWQEFETYICGNPQISVEALKKSARYEDLNPDEERVRYLWLALNNFTNEERSRFLRFVTGRRRLPTPLYICPDKGDDISQSNCLPESSTCSNTLFLPHYADAAICEEKLRYAIYNCIAIDTDMSPWDD